jgi:hypothetical protein
VTEIHVGSGRFYKAPVGTDPDTGAWTHIGWADEGTVTYTIDDDAVALRVGVLLQPRSMSWEVKLTRRQLRNLLRVMNPPRRPRRRNPLHAVRDRLRRYNRARAWAAKGAHGRR